MGKEKGEDRIVALESAKLLYYHPANTSQTVSQEAGNRLS